MRRIIAIFLLFAMIFPQRTEATTEKYIALTFDDGPSGRFTRRLLEGLQERNVKATFLLCGYRIAQYSEITEQIFSAGHEIGLHGYSHNDMGQMNYDQAAKEITNTIALLPEKCHPAFLRPPGGSCCDAAARAAADLGLALLDWSVDPRDWCCDNSRKITQFVTSHVRAGDVILLHDMSDSSVNAAFAIIDQLQTQGFTFVTASQLAQIQGISLQPGILYRHFRTTNTTLQKVNPLYKYHIIAKSNSGHGNPHEDEVDCHNRSADRLPHDQI